MPDLLNDGWTYAARVDPRGEGVGLVDWLARAYRHTDVAGWQARVEAGEVEVDGVVAEASCRLRQGQSVAWHRPPWWEPEVPLDFTVVHEDADLLVVDKPSGLPTVPSGGFLQHTLLAVVQAAYPEATPMHRLGTGTSGLVVFARTAAARSQVQAAWREGLVSRDYRGVLTGVPDWEEVTVRMPIGPVKHAPVGTVHAASATGKPAVTHFAVVGERGGDAIVDVRIETGRPHQIRIHAACTGHPLKWDPLYGPGGLPVGDALPTACGYLLHAWRIGVPDPATGHVRVWRAEPGWG